MAENTDINWRAMSDKTILETIGQFVKETRLQQNKTQTQVSMDSGIARSTLVQIENGHGGTLISFIQIMRTLDQLHIIRYFQVKQQISPLKLAKLEQERRLRARRKGDNNNPKTKSDW